MIRKMVSLWIENTFKNTVEMISVGERLIPSNITELSAAGWNLKVVPDGILELTELVELDLSYNELTELPANFGALFNKLEKLNISENKLTTFPDSVFEGLVNLKELNLSWNQLKELSYSVFTLPKLEKLYLHSNQLERLPVNVFEELKNLKIFNISRNRLIEIPSEICNLTELEYLDVSYNQLKTLPRQIARLENLNILNISGNDNFIHDSPCEDGFNVVELVEIFNKINLFI